MKFRLINKFIFILAILGNFDCLYAQSTNLDGIKLAYQSYLNNNLQEKIFVHSDRNVYLSGEIVWFKVYVVESGTNHLIDLSKIVYVDILK